MFGAWALAYETDFDLLLIPIAWLNVLNFNSTNFEFTWLRQAADEGVLIHLNSNIVLFSFIYKIHGSHNASEIDWEEGVWGDAWLYSQNLNHLVTEFDVIGVTNHIVFVWAQVYIMFVLHCD